MLSHVIKRLSHIGKKPVEYSNCVSIVLKPNLKIKKVLFGNTPVENKLIIQGPSGKELVNIHEGLNVKIYPSVVPNENQLTVSIDDDKIKTMSKYERKFVSSMWGTTRSMIRSNIEGVLDVSFTIKKIKNY